MLDCEHFGAQANLGTACGRLAKRAGSSRVFSVVAWPSAIA